MEPFPLSLYLLTGAFLFSAGLFLLLTRKNAIVALMGIELMLNAANLNLVAFGYADPQIKGQVFALFVIVVAAAEASVALALLIRLYEHFKGVHLDQPTELKG